MNAVGVLGGTFDPVHRGHIAVACQARRALRLDHVVLLPCADPPHKPQRTLAARHHRLEMLYLALEGWDSIGISTYEIARGGVHYTLDTLRAFRAAAPRVPPVFLIGSDALADIESWYEYRALLAEFDFAVAVRPDDQCASPALNSWPDHVADRFALLPSSKEPTLGAGGRVFRLAAPTVAVSSSLVRQRCVAGAVIDDLVPTRVARYIQRYGLYRQEAPR